MLSIIQNPLPSSAVLRQVHASPVAPIALQGAPTETQLPVVAAAEKNMQLWFDCLKAKQEQELRLLMVAPEPEEIEAQMFALEANRKSEEQARLRVRFALSAVASSPAVHDAYAARGEFDGIPGLIGDAEGTLLGPIEEALAKYVAMLQEIMDLMGELSSFITADTDEVTISGVFAEKLEDLLKKLEQNPTLASFQTRAEAEAFMKALGLPDLSISGTGPFKIDMNFSQLHDILSTFRKVPPFPGMPDIGGYYNEPMSNPAFQEWINMKDSNVEELQHVSQVLAQRLSRQNQMFNDFASALSKAMEKILQMLMAFVNGIPS